MYNDLSSQIKQLKGWQEVKRLLKVFYIFDTAYLYRLDAEKVEVDWGHKETIKEKYVYASNEDMETFKSEYGTFKVVHGNPLELDSKLIDTILYLQHSDSNGSYIDMVEGYEDGEIEVSTIKELCIRVLTDWMNEETSPDDVKQIKELQEWIDGLKTI